MALIIEGIFISKTVTSLQTKVHECYIKELKVRESLLTIDETNEINTEKTQHNYSSDSDDNEQPEDHVISDKELED